MTDDVLLNSREHLSLSAEIQRDSGLSLEAIELKIANLQDELHTTEDKYMKLVDDKQYLKALIEKKGTILHDSGYIKVFDQIDTEVKNLILEFQVQTDSLQEQLIKAQKLRKVYFDIYPYKKPNSRPNSRPSTPREMKMSPPRLTASPRRISSPELSPRNSGRTMAKLLKSASFKLFSK